MIIERMTFNLKYGKAQESSKIWKESLAHIADVGNQRDFRARFYSSVTGRLCRQVQDLTLKSLNDHNPMMYYWSINTKVQELYRQFVEMCDSSSRAMYKVEHEVGNLQNANGMICECHTFHLQFGKAKDSIALWKEILDEAKNTGTLYLRMMTDIVGPSYTLIVETYYPRLNDITPNVSFWSANEKMAMLHEKFVPLCAIAERDFFFVDFDA